MIGRRTLLAVLLLALRAIPSHAADSGTAARASSAPVTRVLFIGNSYTYVNGGLDAQVHAFDPSIVTTRLANAGYTLEQHASDAHELAAIQEGGFTHVVLQEQSQFPVAQRERFRRAAAKLDAEIKRAGAKTVLLMTWERPDSLRMDVTAGNVAASYTALGQELGVPVAPAGRAFMRSRRERPDLALYQEDGHPTVAGTYLAAAVIYRTLTGHAPPSDGASAPGSASISPEDRAFLSRIASEATSH